MVCVRACVCVYQTEANTPNWTDEVVVQRHTLLCNLVTPYMHACKHTCWEILLGSLRRRHVG